MKLTNITNILKDAVSFSHDDRKGLGYGQTKQTFHVPYKSNNEFPYKKIDNIDIEDEEINDETFDAVNKKILKFQMTDPGAVKASNSLYFLGSATKLRSCFERPDKILEKIIKLENDIVEKENLNRWVESISMTGGFSDSKVFDIRPYKRTGTKRGWSNFPPLSKIFAEEEEENDEFYNLEDLARIHEPTLGECFYNNRYI